MAHPIGSQRRALEVIPGGCGRTVRGVHPVVTVRQDHGRTFTPPPAGGSARRVRDAPPPLVPGRHRRRRRGFLLRGPGAARGVPRARPGRRVRVRRRPSRVRPGGARGVEPGAHRGTNRAGARNLRARAQVRPLRPGCLTRVPGAPTGDEHGVRRDRHQPKVRGEERAGYDVRADRTRGKGWSHRHVAERQSRGGRVGGPTR